MREIGAGGTVTIERNGKPFKVDYDDEDELLELYEHREEFLERAIKRQDKRNAEMMERNRLEAIEREEEEKAEALRLEEQAKEQAKAEAEEREEEKRRAEVRKARDDILKQVPLEKYPALYELLKPIIKQRASLEEAANMLNDFQDDPKKERAYSVYMFKFENPELSVIQLCHALDISQSVYRTERIIHKSEWDQWNQNGIKMEVQEALITANMRGDVWQEDYPGIDITQFKVKG